MRKSGILVASLFLIAVVVGGGQAAWAAAESSTGALMAIDVCACCPATCGGGTLIGCYHVVGMPPNAVTCVYSNSGNGPGCVSCLLAGADTETAALNAIFEASSPAGASAAE
jgi:hypothetical protein